MVQILAIQVQSDFHRDTIHPIKSRRTKKMIFKLLT